MSEYFADEIEREDEESIASTNTGKKKMFGVLVLGLVLVAGGFGLYVFLFGSSKPNPPSHGKSSYSPVSAPQSQENDYLRRAMASKPTLPVPALQPASSGANTPLPPLKIDLPSAEQLHPVSNSVNQPVSYPSPSFPAQPDAFPTSAPARPVLAAADGDVAQGLRKSPYVTITSPAPGTTSTSSVLVPVEPGTEVRARINQKVFPVLGALVKAVLLEPVSNVLPAGTTVIGSVYSSDSNRIYVQFDQALVAQNSLPILAVARDGRDGADGLPAKPPMELGKKLSRGGRAFLGLLPYGAQGAQMLSEFDQPSSQANGFAFGFSTNRQIVYGGGKITLMFVSQPVVNSVNAQGGLDFFNQQNNLLQNGGNSFFPGYQVNNGFPPGQPVFPQGQPVYNQPGQGQFPQPQNPYQTQPSLPTFQRRVK